VEFVEDVDERGLLGIRGKARRVRQRELTPPADVDKRVGQTELADVVVDRKFLVSELSAQHIPSSDRIIIHTIMHAHDSWRTGRPKVRGDHALDARDLCSRSEKPALRFQNLRRHNAEEDVYALECLYHLLLAVGSDVQDANLYALRLELLGRRGRSGAANRAHSLQLIVSIVEWHLIAVHAPDHRFEEDRR
jgi:hypothetical protein